MEISALNLTLLEVDFYSLEEYFVSHNVQLYVFLNTQSKSLLFHSANRGFSALSTEYQSRVTL